MSFKVQITNQGGSVLVVTEGDIVMSYSGQIVEVVCIHLANEIIMESRDNFMYFHEVRHVLSEEKS